MMMRRRRGKRGFTLIELMIVVAIIGILAALAIYGVRRYLTNAKTSEATNFLGRMAKDSISAFEREAMAATLLAADDGTAAVHKMCVSVEAPNPATVPPGEKMQPDIPRWKTDVGWKCLKFSIESPVYYQYSYSSDATDATAGTTFTAFATGNLNNSGGNSEWKYTGALLDGALRMASTIEEPEDPEE